MGDSRALLTVAAVAGVWTLAACSGSQGDDRARRQPSAAAEAAAPNGAAEDIGVGPVTCAGGELFVANGASNTIVVHDRTAAGDRAPLRTIAGPATGLVTTDDVYAPRSLAVDGLHGELVALAGKAVQVHAREAAGDVAPLRTIAGASTGLYLPGGVAVDLVHDELWVADLVNLSAFSRTAAGDVAPLRTISSGTSAYYYSDLALDVTNDELVVVTTSPAIVVYSRTATGLATPLRTIAGAATGLTHPAGVAVDAGRDEIVVADGLWADSSVRVYARTASGDVAPLRTISGSATGLYYVDGIAVDAGADELFVANGVGANTVVAFPRTASGNVAPLRTLEGAYTALAWPQALALLAEDAYCALGSACAAGGCMPAGSLDCLDGHYCPQGAVCDSWNGQTFCPIPGVLPTRPGAEICAFGTGCPSGSLCASGGCMPSGGVDCGSGGHCPRAHVCSWNRAYCLPESGTDCLNGRYCGAGLLCNSGGLYCMPPGVVDCGGGYYCPSGKTCAPSGDGMVCNDPAAGGAYCYSTSACIPSAISDGCECAGATTPGQCVSGHPACSGVGGPCDDGDACCVGETCIYNQCVAGCGQCTGKGCQL